MNSPDPEDHPPHTPHVGKTSHDMKLRTSFTNLHQVAEDLTEEEDYAFIGREELQRILDTSGKPPNLSAHEKKHALRRRTIQRGTLVQYVLMHANNVGEIPTQLLPPNEEAGAIEAAIMILVDDTVNTSLTELGTLWPQFYTGTDEDLDKLTANIPDRAEVPILGTYMPRLDGTFQEIREGIRHTVSTEMLEEARARVRGEQREECYPTVEQYLNHFENRYDLYMPPVGVIDLFTQNRASTEAWWWRYADWATGQRRPYAAQLMETLYRFSPDEVLLPEMLLTAEKRWNKLPSTRGLPPQTRKDLLQVAWNSFDRLQEVNRDSWG